jgi:carbamoyltransferase
LQDRLQTADVFVPPSPADAGLALGAAAWSSWQATGRRPRWTPDPYLGPPVEAAAIDAALHAATGIECHELADPVGSAVDDLVAGRIVGWFQGGSEYGPRALGNRTILADPADPWSREKLNNLVKHREWFRPYAPVCSEEAVSEIFESWGAVPFMMHVAPVRTERIGEMPGGVHVDSSARLQTVCSAQNPLFYSLVTRFIAASGSPTVINTSLNLDGMPIVESPDDALACLRGAPAMDALYIGRYRVRRN